MNEQKLKPTVGKREEYSAPNYERLSFETSNLVQASEQSGDLSNFKLDTTSCAPVAWDYEP